MLIDIRGQYENLVEDRDFYEIIEREISPEFLREFENLTFKKEEEVRCFYEEIYGRVDPDDLEEGVKEELEEMRDELISDLRPIKEGKRLNRKAIIESFENLIESLDSLLQSRTGLTKGINDSGCD